MIDRSALRPAARLGLALGSFLVASVAAAGPSDAPPEKSAGSDRPRKVVLIAGPADPNHAAGTHDYAETVRVIKAALEASNVADKVAVETHFDGWPTDPATLDDADAIVLFASGADRDEQAHPFLVGDRLAVVERQMKRGCGLAMVHWCLFTPVEHEKKFAEWVGGFFDYERGDDPRGWHSDITFATATVDPDDRHPIARGVKPFEHRDEYYYNIRFREGDDRVRPVVRVELPDVEEPQTVAWAVKRADGGRGFGFTGGHFQKSWRHDDYRKLMLNAVCWTAGVQVPAGGVTSPRPADMAEAAKGES